MIVVVEIGRLPQDISAATILRPSRPWKISRFECRAFFDFHDRERKGRETCLSLKFIRNQRWLSCSYFFLFSFFSLFFPRDFIFNVATRYSIQPTHRIERGGRKMGGEEGVHDSTLKAVRGLIIQISQYSKN